MLCCPLNNTAFVHYGFIYVQHHILAIHVEIQINPQGSFRGFLTTAINQKFYCSCLPSICLVTIHDNKKAHLTSTRGTVHLYRGFSVVKKKYKIKMQHYFGIGIDVTQNKKISNGSLVHLIKLNSINFVPVKSG